jgi:(p)ppGpp synthase/HD superfamily hydrolase
MNVKSIVNRIDTLSQTPMGCEELMRDLAQRSDVVERAIKFAVDAHEGQVRKYIEIPYVSHTLAVASIIDAINGDDNMVIAGLLHDAVEDTDVSIADIHQEFGTDVADLVSDLTDVSTLDMGNRKVRKEIDRNHTAGASDRAKTIKLADIIHNSLSIREHGGGFADVWLKEKELLLDVLGDGDPRLYEFAQTLI